MEEGFSEIHSIPISDAHFLRRLFMHFGYKDAESALGKIFELDREIQISFLCEASKIHDAFRFRALNRSLCCARYLIDDKGLFSPSKLKELITRLEHEGFICYPGGFSDAQITNHLLKILKKMRDQDLLVRKLKRFSLPLCHTKAENLVRQVLGLESDVILQDAHLRQAVLSALLCPLRQNVGSCFATAPAILIQEEQTELLLDDLYELLMTGKLKRIIQGKEYSIPMSPSSGVGDLKKNIFALNAEKDLFYSPALLEAFVKIGLIEEKEMLEKQIERLKQYVAPHLEERRFLTLEELIEEVLLNYYSISKKEVNQFEEVENKMPSPFLRESSEKFIFTQFKEACDRAKSIFKGFSEQLILKTWEYSIASFSEVKLEFSRWNLFISLGLDPQEKAGIGEIIYQRLDQQLQMANEQIEKMQKEYEIAFDQVRATELLMRQAAGEAEIRRLKAEHFSRMYHMQTCLEMRDKFHAKATHYSQFLSFLIHQYHERFPAYFQEIYDAEMQDVKQSFYDDSPAGFRLIYKHGRSDASAWTFIYNKEEYVRALVDFFLSTENAISAASDFPEVEKDMHAITSAIVLHLRSELFIQGALVRMARAHGLSVAKLSLDALDKIEKKPWAYTSGGTLTTLLKTYFKREGEISSEGRWVDSATDLFVSIIDTFKALPPMITEDFVRNPQRRILMTSPTHAFSIFPGEAMIRKGWEEKLFTYSWVRDEVTLPGKRFYEKMQLTREEQLYLVEKFSDEMPLSLAHQVRSQFQPSKKTVSVKEFRNECLALFSENKVSVAAELDGYLYKMLPLISGNHWKHYVQLLLENSPKDILDRYPDQLGGFLSAFDLRNIAAAMRVHLKQSTCFAQDLYRDLIRPAEKWGLAPPSTILFADTNWSCNHFAFVVNPGTMELELWRMDRSKVIGKPMSIWKEWLDGSHRDPWLLYSRPYEYRLV